MLNSSFLLERRRHHLHAKPFVLIVHHFISSLALFFSGILYPDGLSHHSRHRLPVDTHQLHVEVATRVHSLLAIVYLLDMIPHEILSQLVFRDVGLEADVTPS